MLYTVVFLLYSKVNQLYYIHPSSLDLAVSHRPPSQPSRSLQSTDLSSVCNTYTVASHWLPVLHMAVYMCKILISQFAHPSFPHCVHMLVLCVSISALQIGSSVPFFWIPHICVIMRYLFFSFWLTSFCITDPGAIHISVNDPNFIPFLWLSNIPLHTCTTSSLYLYLLMDI